MNELWTRLAARANVTLDEAQQQKLSRYLDLLFEANQRMNLTRITDRPAAEIQHVGDALTALPFLPAHPHSLADVGSGAGVPGIPLAIARPDVKVTLIESTQKKAAFLRETAAAIGLTNVEVLPERAEHLARPDKRRRFDIVIARALAATDQLVAWCLPLVKPGGTLLAMKGPKVHEELPLALKTIRMLGGGDPVIHPVELPETTGHLVVEIKRKGK